MNEKQLKHSPLEQGVDDGSPVSVTFWMPDGSCDEGKARHVDRNVMFIESKRTLPVGTEVRIRITRLAEEVADWGLGEGTVVWACPSVDQFNNREGFGVSFRGCWSQPSEGRVEAEDLKGSA